MPDLGNLGRRSITWAAVVGVIICLTSATTPSTAASTIHNGSLYSGPEPRPGPDILYAPPAKAPQLSNSGIWNAPPILVSGASAYRGGEYLYQDFLYDDHGARADTRDPGDPRTGGDGFSAPNGTYTYPNSPEYAGNAADFVELRVKALPDATAFRITLNTLHDADEVATTIAIGNSPTPRQFPHGAQAQAPAEKFLTVHGNTADLLNADGTPSDSPQVRVDGHRRQIEVRVPHTTWNPGHSTVRLAAGVGLWDTAKNRYLIPGAAADQDDAGGAAGLAAPTAFFNAAFRFNEPMPRVEAPDESRTNPAYWRDAAQGSALRAGDLTPFHAEVDFGKLAAGLDDDMEDQAHGVPQSGPMNRILASHTETQQGADFSQPCGNAEFCQGQLRGQLQPYAIYVPHEAPESGRYGLTLLLHSLTANYNQFLGSRNQSQFGERSPGSIVITPEARGPDGWYYHHAAADVFEVWADIAAHYPLDPDRTAIAGYSMGGYGTYKLATRYPDLFARAQPTVGPPGLGIWNPPQPPTGGESTNTYRQIDSLRHVPTMMWVAAADQLVPITGTQQQARRFDELGYRYVFDVFSPAEHHTLALNDQYAPAAGFLGASKVERNPAHITYVVNPAMDFDDVGTVADHAYWLSDLRLRDGSGPAPLGKIDAHSKGFGAADPQPSGTELTSGTLTGGTLPALTYARQAQSWGPARGFPAENVLTIAAENIAQVTINPQRATVDCDVELRVKTDGPLTVTLRGCGRTESFG